MEALSAEAIRKISEVEAQCLAVLTELGLPGIAPLEARLEEIVKVAILALPPSTEAWHLDGYPQALRELAADHLGAVGTARILEHLGVESCDEEFLVRARALFPYSVLGDVARSWDPRACAKPTARRVYGYAEWELMRSAAVGGAALPRPGQALSGHLLRENGYVGRITWRNTWLRPSQLPNNPHIDHTYCSEFQIMSEICEGVILEGLASTISEAKCITGWMQLLISTTPCLSCTCAFQQFRLIFPGVTVRFAQLRPWEVKGSYGGAPQEQAEAELAASQ